MADNYVYFSGAKAIAFNLQEKSAPDMTAACFGHSLRDEYAKIIL